MKLHPFCLAAIVLVPAAAAQWRRDYDVRRNVVYVERDGRPLTLDLYVPEGREGPHPFGVVIHGGAWRKGSKNGPDAAAFCRLLLEKGIAAATIDYRLVPRAVHPAQIRDCRRAVQFLRARAAAFGLDPTRVATLGASAGGHLAALLGTEADRADPRAEDPIARQSTRPTCVVSFFGPMNLEPHPAASRKAVRIVKSFLGGGDESDPADVARARAASPLHHVSAGDAPMVLVHGTLDPLVPLWHSVEMAAALRREGICHRLIRVEGGSHGDFVIKALLRHETQESDFWVESQRFLVRHLRRERREPCPARARTASPSRRRGSAGRG